MTSYNIVHRLMHAMSGSLRADWADKVYPLLDSSFMVEWRTHFFADDRERAKVRLDQLAQLLNLVSVSCWDFDNRNQERVYRFRTGRDSVFAWIVLRQEYGYFWIAGPAAGDVSGLRDALVDVLGSLREADAADGVRLFVGSYGIKETARIHCPSWQEIRGNYPDRVRRSIESLLEGDDRAQAGSMIVWHGLPGTGKTWAIRSLMRELQDRYLPVVIPESSDFLRDKDAYYDLVDEIGDALPLMFILEDTADPLMESSRAMHGTEISKFLNLTDGLLKREREDLFVVTFNEKVEELDPAIVRPGRCRNNTEFGRFSPEEATACLHARGRNDIAVTEPTTLAELYARLNGEEIEASLEPESRRVTGFSVS
jgi:hypothetical protein